MSLSPETSPLHHLENATAHFRQLLKSEWTLARREVSRNLKAARLGLILVACGIALLFSAVFALTTAVFLGLSLLGLSPAAAALATGGTVSIFALGFIWLGLARLSPQAIAPTETTAHAVQTLRLVTENLHVK